MKYQICTPFIEIQVGMNWIYQEIVTMISLSINENFVLVQSFMEEKKRLEHSLKY